MFCDGFIGCTCFLHCLLVLNGRDVVTNILQIINETSILSRSKTNASTNSLVSRERVCSKIKYA